MQLSCSCLTALLAHHTSTTSTSTSSQDNQRRGGPDGCGDGSARGGSKGEELDGGEERGKEEGEGRGSKKQRSKGEGQGGGKETGVQLTSAGAQLTSAGVQLTSAGAPVASALAGCLWVCQQAALRLCQDGWSACLRALGASKEEGEGAGEAGACVRESVCPLLTLVPAVCLRAALGGAGGRGGGAGAREGATGARGGGAGGKEGGAGGRGCGALGRPYPGSSLSTSAGPACS